MSEFEMFTTTTNSNDYSFEELTFIEFLQDRRIIINDEIDDCIVERAIMQIIKWNKEDDLVCDNNINLEIQKRKPIEIYVNSVGGLVDVGICLCNVIQNSKTPVYGFALGRAYSMGALILLSCHKKFAYNGSVIMLHDGSIELRGSKKETKDVMKFWENLDFKLKQLVLKNSQIPEEMLNAKFDTGTDWYLTAEEALSYRVIDEIIG